MPPVGFFVLLLSLSLRYVRSAQVTFPCIFFGAHLWDPRNFLFFLASQRLPQLVELWPLFFVKSFPELLQGTRTPSFHPPSPKIQTSPFVFPGFLSSLRGVFYSYSVPCKGTCFVLTSILRSFPAGPCEATGFFLTNEFGGSKCPLALSFLLSQLSLSFRHRLPDR